MERYQPEYIEDQTVKEILKSCIPFIGEEEGRYWLRMAFPMHSRNESLANSIKRVVKNIIAEGLNSIDKTGNLKQIIALRKAVLQKDHVDNRSLYEKELALLIAWQKALEADDSGIEQSPGFIDPRDDLSLSVFNPLLKEGLLCRKDNKLYPNPEKFRTLQQFFSSFFRFYKSSKYARPSENEMKKLYWIKDKKNGVLEHMNPNTVHNYYSTLS